MTRSSAIVVAILALALAACGSTPLEERVVGTWESSDHDTGFTERWTVRADHGLRTEVGTGDDTSGFDSRWEVTSAEGDRLGIRTTREPVGLPEDVTLVFDGDDAFTVEPSGAVFHRAR
ncbi:MAG: hypothetical protein KC619_24975 [Myxococcales bacterium]|nr:hypothetical protein [Myxococcales bacterium]